MMLGPLEGKVEAMLKTILAASALMLVLVVPSTSAIGVPILILVSPTTDSAVGVPASYADLDSCIITEAIASVNAFGGAAFTYAWSVGWSFTTDEGTTIDGPSGSSDADGRTTISERREIRGPLRIYDGWSIQGSAEITNNEFPFDFSFAFGFWTCDQGELVEQVMELIGDAAPTEAERVSLLGPTSVRPEDPL